MKTQAMQDGTKLWVQHAGRIYCIEEKKANRSRTNDEAEALVAPFPCKVLKLIAPLGTPIKAGDPVLSVEAMKMEHTFTSPKDGVLESFSVAAGEIVDEGKAFVRWESK